MELLLKISDPLYSEVETQARKCGLTPRQFAEEVVASFAATRRFWRTDFPVIESTEEPEAQPVTAEPGIIGCVDPVEGETQTRKGLFASGR